MAGIQTALGATWAISTAAPTTYDDNITTGYPSLTYTEVGSVESLGSVGATYEDVTFTPLKDGTTQHRKGAKDNGQMQVSMAVDTDDAGQILVAAGVDGAEKYTVFSHKITYADGATRYFSGQIYSNPETVGDASAMILSEVNVMVSTDVVKVAAP